MKPSEEAICIECDRKHYARGWCYRHYLSRYWRKTPKGKEARKRFLAKHPGYAYRAWKKSRLKHTDTRNAQRRRSYDRGAAHLRLDELSSHRIWKPDEDAKVLAHTIPDRQLAVEIRRSTRAITIRRWRLKHSV